MTLIWVMFGFVDGWLACWWFGAKVTKTVLRRPDSETTVRIVSTMTQESLLKLRALVDSEVGKRRAA